MPLQDASQREAQRILDLARSDASAAREILRGLGVDEQVALVCELPVAARARLLDLLPSLENVVPALPEAELCFTAKAIGLADAGWILEHATLEQIQVCLDLDVWRDQSLDAAALGDWLGALADAGDETLVRAARGIDPELLYLFVRSRIAAQLKPNEEGWEPDPGSQTLEGQFYFRALAEGDDVALVARLLRVLFEHDYWLYFRMLQALTWEDPLENETYAARWREGRLEDLGFPSFDEAMRIYGRLRPEERTLLPEHSGALATEAFRLPVWLPRLPVAIDAHHLVFRAAAALGDDERRAFFFAFVALANAVAIADRLPLGDAESTPRAIEKAATLASRGLDWLARRHGSDTTSILRRATVARLFRVGANLERDERRDTRSGPP
ncbi:MAG: hypothetical protein IT386_02070 [Deltaproteobacteria bacterium]|nr:hypothetical protein [Deltaproteobacteria bacterium]